MFHFRKKPRKSIKQVVINNQIYQINLFYEQRKNSRVSITKSGINIRIDNRLPKDMQHRQLGQFLSWAKHTIEEKGHVFAPKGRIFKNQEILEFYDENLVLQINQTNQKKIEGSIKNGILQVDLPNVLSTEIQHQQLSKMITKLIRKKYQSKIENKVHQYNEKFGLGRINQIRLKNNATNWGSCSSKNNINISIRLLLAPEFAVNYVIIHELCHLVHRNHSKKFWQLVATCFPEYQQAETWLKQNASKCVI